MVSEKKTSNYCEQGFTNAQHPLATARDYPAAMTPVSGTTPTGSWKMERKTAEFEAFVKRNTTHSSHMSLHQSRHWSITPRWATMEWGTELTLEALSCLPANTHPVQLVKITLNYLLGKLPSHCQKKPLKSENSSLAKSWHFGIAQVKRVQWICFQTSFLK